jgi:hypothetical protein
LAKTVSAVRQVFHGKLTYASLIWERVDWDLFDFVGVDHYWGERIQAQYLDLMKPLFAIGKPIVVTEFGFNTTKASSMGARSLGNVDHRSLFLHRLPVFGRVVRPRLARINERDEHMQAERLVGQLKLLESAGVNGAFVFCFVFPLNIYDENPEYDLDRESASPVKSYSHGRCGTLYPDMTWDPKESFHAVADYYLSMEQRRPID